jgi:hypothetical protein
VHLAVDVADLERGEPHCYKREERDQCRYRFSPVRELERDHEVARYPVTVIEAEMSGNDCLYLVMTTRDRVQRCASLLSFVIHGCQRVFTHVAVARSSKFQGGGVTHLARLRIRVCYTDR